MGSILVGTAIAPSGFRARFLIVLVQADEPFERIEDRPAREPQDHRRDPGGDLALVLLGIVGRVVEHVHRAFAEPVGDARRETALVEIGAHEREVGLEQRQRRIAQRPVIGKLPLELAHRSRLGSFSIARISRSQRPAAVRPATSAPITSSPTTSALAPHAVSAGARAMISPTVRPISARKARRIATAPNMTAPLARSATKAARVFW